MGAQQSGLCGIQNMGLMGLNCCHEARTGSSSSDYPPTPLRPKRGGAFQRAWNDKAKLCSPVHQRSPNTRVTVAASPTIERGTKAIDRAVFDTMLNPIEVMTGVDIDGDGAVGGKTQTRPWKLMSEPISSTDKYALHAAAQQQDFAGVQRLLAQNRIDVNLRDEYGRTALHFAAHVGAFEICQALIRVGARTDERTINLPRSPGGKTYASQGSKDAEMCAAEANHRDVVRLLMVQGRHLSHNDIFYLKKQFAARTHVCPRTKLLKSSTIDLSHKICKEELRAQKRWRGMKVKS